MGNAFDVPPPDAPKYLYEIILAARQTARKTQKEYAEYLGMYQPALSLLESGKNYNLRIEDLIFMAHAIGVAPRALIEAAYTSATNPRGEPRPITAGVRLSGSPSKVARKRLDMMVPSVDAKGHLRVGPNGDLIPVEDPAVAAMREITTAGDADPMHPKPNFGWKAVAAVPIHIDDIPFADDDLEESPGNRDLDPDSGFVPDGSGLPRS